MEKATPVRILLLLWDFFSYVLMFCVTCIRLAQKYDSNDAGYGIVDAALKLVTQHELCRWITITTSDNAYGSEV